jgi:hypothetical protein
MRYAYASGVTPKLGTSILGILWEQSIPLLS